MNEPTPPRSHPRRRLRAVFGAIAMLTAIQLFTHCTSTGASLAGPEPSHCILVGGERVGIGTRVVTFEEEDGYSAYLRGKHFDRSEPADGERRYGERPGDPQTLADLQPLVHQFVLHYDMAGTSRQCFKVLQDVRTLSVHFMLDVDGTIYQTLDVKERAWHATIANDRAIGIEIAHPGAYAQPMSAVMRRWYASDDDGWRMQLPKWMKESGIRTPDFVARPDRPDLVSGEVQGRQYHQLDFTPEQYEALPKLIAGLHRALPRIRLEAPRDADGAILDHVMPRDELLAFDGIIGHFHVQKNKQDPGPAFQWERVLRDARAIAGER